jgi:protein-tyrosine phosphatase
MRRILFVCHGNICRSPMAEFILKALVKAYGLDGLYYIESAGVSDEEYGNPIYPPAKRCLNQHGVWFDPRKTAREVTRSDYSRFDRIIYMDHSNRRWLDRIFGGDPEGKIHSMMSYAGKSRDVADPWYTGDFESAFQDSLEGCEAMLSGETVSQA